jgi:hypothetical protein
LGNDVELRAGSSLSLDFTLRVTIEEQRVTIAGDTPVNSDAGANANQTVLSGRELAALPDDPDELAAVLQALAGPGAGPNGGQIFVDGFSGAALPSKSAIREVRINQNPFAPENDQPAARIDVFTRPGTDTLKVSTYLNFNDESFNSRNPFTSHRQSFQVRQFGGSLSGTLIKNRASYFIDVERREIDDNELVTATVLDSNLNPVVIGEGALTPRRFITFNPRVDYAINNFNTLVARYTYSHSNLENNGVGGFSLLQRARWVTVSPPTTVGSWGTSRPGKRDHTHSSWADASAAFISTPPTPPTSVANIHSLAPWCPSWMPTTTS